MNPEIDTELELICLKCIEREPEKRYDSAAALATDLENWLSGNPISIKAPSVFRLAARWAKKHQRLIYILFAFFISVMFCLPFMTSIIGGGSTTDLGEVYQYFPDEEPPLMYSIPIPDWVPIASTIIMFLVIWPSIGLMNHVVSRPTSIGGAFVAGVVTSTICGIVIFAMIGWMFLILGTTGDVSNQLLTVAEAVWVPDGADPEKTLEAANNVIPGLDKVPVNERASVLSDRVINDQLARAPWLMLRMAVAGIMFIVPTIIGSMIAFVLVSRKTRLWITIPRYLIAWLSLTALTISILVFVAGDRVNGRPAREFPVGFSIFWACCLLVAWLALRRWRKTKSKLNLEPPTDEQVTNKLSSVTE